MICKSDKVVASAAGARSSITHAYIIIQHDIPCIRSLTLTLAFYKQYNSFVNKMGFKCLKIVDALQSHELLKLTSCEHFYMANVQIVKRFNSSLPV